MKRVPKKSRPRRGHQKRTRSKSKRKAVSRRSSKRSPSAPKNQLRISKSRKTIVARVRNTGYPAGSRLRILKRDYEFPRAKILSSPEIKALIWAAARELWSIKGSGLYYFRIHFKIDHTSKWYSIRRRQCNTKTDLKHYVDDLTFSLSEALIDYLTGTNERSFKFKGFEIEYAKPVRPHAPKKACSRRPVRRNRHRG